MQTVNGQSVSERQSAHHKSIDVSEFFVTATFVGIYGHVDKMGNTVLQGMDIYADGTGKISRAITEYDKALVFQIANLSLANHSVYFSHSVSRAASIKSKMERERKTTFLTWLSPSHWEVGSERMIHTHRRTPGTLQWVLRMEMFGSWRSQTYSNNPVLWLTGVGKSMASALIIDLIEGSYPDCCLIFLLQGDAKLMNVNNICCGKSLYYLYSVCI